MNPKHSTLRNIAVLSCMVAVLVPSAAMLAPRPAHALFGSEALAVKEYTLDSVAWMVKRAAVAALVRSSVNWINSGFKGSPAFVTNLRENLLVVGDTVAEHFFDELTGTIIDSPFQDEIALAVRTGYYLSTGGTFYLQNPFTLNQYSNDPRAFLGGDFSQGGFSALFSTVMNCQNNPYCAYQQTLGELNNRITSKVGYESKLLDWGQGFKSFRGDCDASVTPAMRAAADGAMYAGETSEQAAARAAADASNVPVPLAKSEPCLDAGIRTPGAIIAPRLNEALGAGERELISADEINEVVGSLFAQLVNQAFGSGGLVQVSTPSYGGGRPYIDQATDTSQAQIGGGTSGSSAGGVSQNDVITYLSNWQKIGANAESALAICPTSTFIQQARASADAATARGTNALAALDSASSATAASTVSAADVELSRAEARDDTDSSLYGQLQEIISTKRCPSN